MAKHEYYAVQGKTLGNIAETMKTVLGVDKDTPIRFDEITNNEKVEQVTESVDVQAEVIEQIKAALNGKSSIGVKEIMEIIDQSGVLGTTDGTVQEKINKVLKMAKWKNYIQQGLYFRPNTVHLLFADIDNPDILDLDFSRQTIMGSMFRGNPSLKEFVMDLSIVRDVNAILAQCSNLEKVVLTNTQDVKSWPNAFSGCEKLVSIETLNWSSATSVGLAFKNCVSLETIKFVPETIKISIVIASPVLSAESIQSIFDGLSTVETAQTLTLHKDAKILQSQVDSANAKGWTVAGGTVVSEEEYYG